MGTRSIKTLLYLLRDNLEKEWLYDMRKYKNGVGMCGVVARMEQRGTISPIERHSKLYYYLDANRPNGKSFHSLWWTVHTNRGLTSRLNWIDKQIAKLEAEGK